MTTNDRARWATDRPPYSAGGLHREVRAAAAVLSRRAEEGIVENVVWLQTAVNGWATWRGTPEIGATRRRP